MKKFTKRRVVFAAVAIALVAATATSAFFLRATPTQASPVTASYTGVAGSFAVPTGASAKVPKGVAPDLAFQACANTTDLTVTPVDCGAPDDSGNQDSASLTGSTTHVSVAAKGGHKPNRHAPSSNSAFNGGTTKANSHGAPHSGGTTLAKQGNVLANFNGISDVDSHTANGFHVTPPDQALCVGRASALQGAGLSLAVSGSTTVVVEAVNEAWSVYSTTGALLFGPDSLTDLFSDPGASGDVICTYDTATQTFFFGEIGELAGGPDVGQVGTDVAILNKNGYTPYQIDTSVGGTCFPDFPHQGYNTHAYYLSIDEFCGPDEDFVGTDLWAVSKSQLAAHSATVNFVTFGPLALASDPILALQPAFGDQSDTEYLVNSFPYDQFGNDNSVSSSLGLWQVHGDQNITSGHGTVTLQGRVIASESYAFPQPAASTGDGSTPAGAQSYVIKEPFLNPDDSRMEQVQLTNTPKGLRLYTSLNTALSVDNDPSARDGVSWFEIDPSAQKVTNQGYIGVAGTYLLYPSILRADSGLIEINFSLTSTTINPSTGYVYMKNGGHSFSQVQFTGIGFAAHQSFADVLFGGPRWGDYSATALDPAGNIWAADEYVPAPPGGTDLVDNWGTRVWSVSGN